MPHHTIAVMILILVTSTSCSDEELFLENEKDSSRLDSEEKVPIFDATGVAGSIARLPCDLSTKLAGDKVHLVLWYKEGQGDGVGVRIPLIPVYSFDARSGDESDEEPQHWSDVATFGGRAHFHHDNQPAALAIDAVRDKDSGVYRCRVDFKRTPTRNSRVNLTIIIPPERLSVVDLNGVHIQHYILGPYAEGASLEIACIATGGRPTPRVTWWQENALLDDSWETLAGRSVRNVLKIDRLERKHLNTVFTCQASNNNLVAPISSAVTLDLNLSPLWVRLLGVNKPVSAGQSQEVRCESVGGRPAPLITWWKGSHLLTNFTQEASVDGNRTVSTLHYTPTMVDSAALLKCRASASALTAPNPPLPPLEDSWLLNVRHLPVVSLEMGGDGDARFVKEGSDVSLECIVRANPWIYRVTWKHNGRFLYDNGYNNDVILNNQSLLIRNVSRSHTGYYSCTASNQEGDGDSHQFHLGVKFAPVCRPGQQTVIITGSLEPLRVSCEVEADPDDVTFTWSHSSSSVVTDNVLQFDVESTRSTAVVTPMTSADFGNLSCWAANVLGKQKQPCVFQLVSAGMPEAVTNCTVVNGTMGVDGGDEGGEIVGVEVWCEAGFDGGLGQSFQLELYDTDSHQLLRNLTAPHPQPPHFILDPLPAADSRRLDIHIYAFNHKGRSRNVTLRVHNSNKAERRTAAVTVKLTPLVGALIGVVGSLILITLAVALALYLRSRECPPPHKQKSPSLDSLENNPDIITNCNGHEIEEKEDVDKLLRVSHNKGNANHRTNVVNRDDLADPIEEESILKSPPRPTSTGNSGDT